MSAPKWAVGMQKLGAGMYVDSDNGWHFSPEEFCAALGVPPTPANLQEAERIAIQKLQEHFGQQLEFTQIRD